MIYYIIVCLRVQGGVSWQRRKNTSRKRKKKQSKKKKDSQSFLKDEIIILSTLAAGILLLISNFGIGGFVGDAVSSVLFGLFGINRIYDTNTVVYGNCICNL